MYARLLAEAVAISRPREVSEDLGQRQQSTEPVMQTFIGEKWSFASKQLDLMALALYLPFSGRTASYTDKVR